MAADRDGKFLVVRPTGRLDSSNAAAFGETLTGHIENGDVHLLIDLEDLSYISSAGLRSLLVAAKQAETAQGKVVLCAVGEPVREVFEVSGFLSIFPVYATRAEAAGAA